MDEVYPEMYVPVSETIPTEISGSRIRELWFKISVIFVLLFCTFNIFIFGYFIFLGLSSFFYRAITVFLLLIFFSNIGAKLSLLLITAGEYENF